MDCDTVNKKKTTCSHGNHLDMPGNFRPHLPCDDHSRVLYTVPLDYLLCSGARWKGVIYRDAGSAFWRIGVVAVAPGFAELTIPTLNPEL
jgi:hypothetical protein